MSASLHSLTLHAADELGRRIARNAENDARLTSDLAHALLRTVRVEGVPHHVRIDALARVIATLCHDEPETDAAATALLYDAGARMGGYLGVLLSLPLDHPARVGVRRHTP